MICYVQDSKVIIVKIIHKEKDKKQKSLGLNHAYSVSSSDVIKKGVWSCHSFALIPLVRYELIPRSCENSPIVQEHYSIYT